ncbi:MAG: TIGR02466 family protein [Gammaproteobacteria bacterium]
MPVRSLFPTLVYAARLQGAGTKALNHELLKESGQIQAHDAPGRRWSARRYPGGYTSYGSLCHLHKMSSTFTTLERKLRRHVDAFVRSLEFDMHNRELVMTDCWINIMPRGVVHSLHLHPHATISGTYYVKAPRGCAGLKLEDPRLDRFMAAPSRRQDASEALQPWVTIPAVAGQVVMFESWLRHEVPPNPSATDRVSISFNYNWF